MIHLTTDEMLEFVTMTKLNARTRELSAYVTGHIVKCEECRNKLSAYQAIYGELCQRVDRNRIEGIIKYAIKNRPSDENGDTGSLGSLPKLQK